MTHEYKLSSSVFVYFIGVVILLSLLLYVITHYKHVCQNISQFKQPLPKDSYKGLVSEFGSPQALINQINGVCIWFPSKIYENSPYESVILKDQESNPIYTTIIVNIDRNKIKNITDIYKDVHYDIESGELSVRSSSSIFNKKVILSILEYIYNNKTLTDCSIILNHSLVDNIPIANTFFSDRYDDDIMGIITKNPYDNRKNKELLLSQV